MPPLHPRALFPNDKSRNMNKGHYIHLRNKLEILKLTKIKEEFLKLLFLMIKFLFQEVFFAAFIPDFKWLSFSQQWSVHTIQFLEPIITPSTRSIRGIIALLTNNTGLGPGFSHNDWQKSSRDHIIWRYIDWLASPKIRIVVLSFAEFEIDKTVNLKRYLPLSRTSKHQLIREYFNLLFHERFNLHWSAKWTRVHMRIQLMSFVVQGLFFQWSYLDIWVWQ